MNVLNTTHRHLTGGHEIVTHKSNQCIINRCFVIEFKMDNYILLKKSDIDPS